MVFKPFKGEVLDGVVSEVKENVVQVNVGPLRGAIAQSVLPVATLSIEHAARLQVRAPRELLFVRGTGREDHSWVGNQVPAIGRHHKDRQLRKSRVGEIWRSSSSGSSTTRLSGSYKSIGSARTIYTARHITRMIMMMAFERNRAFLRRCVMDESFSSCEVI